MSKKIIVEITIDGLPEKPNHHRLAAELEERIGEAVGFALCETFDDGVQGKDWSVHVPSF